MGTNNYAAQTASGVNLSSGAIPVGAGSVSQNPMGQRPNYGFSGGLQNAAMRGSNLVMNASNDVTAESSEDKENLLNKPKT